VVAHEKQAREEAEAQAQVAGMPLPAAAAAASAGLGTAAVQVPPVKEELVIGFGRFNPPTAGHLLLLDAIAGEGTLISVQRCGPHVTFSSAMLRSSNTSGT